LASAFGTLIQPGGPEILGVHPKELSTKNQKVNRDTSSPFGNFYKMAAMVSSILGTVINSTARQLFVGPPEGTDWDLNQHLSTTVIASVMKKGQSHALKKEKKLKQKGILNPEYTAYIQAIHAARTSMDGLAVKKPSAQHTLSTMEVIRDNSVYDSLITHAETLFPSKTTRTNGEKVVVPVEVVTWSDTPHPPDSDFVILYLHGGAYTLGSPLSHRWASLRLAKRLPGTKIYVPHYSLAPEHKYPAGLADCISVYIHLSSTYKNIIVAGDSAGGGMTVALTSYLRDEKKTLPKSLCLLSPWVDMTFSDPSMQLHVRKKGRFFTNAI
jgi:hypothetical protein